MSPDAVVSDFKLRDQRKGLRPADAAEHATKTSVEIYALGATLAATGLLARRDHRQERLNPGDQRNCGELSRI